MGCVEKLHRVEVQPRQLVLHRLPEISMDTFMSRMQGDPHWCSCRSSAALYITSLTNCFIEEANHGRLNSCGLSKKSSALTSPTCDPDTPYRINAIPMRPGPPLFNNTTKGATRWNRRFHWTSHRSDSYLSATDDVAGQKIQ